MFRFIALILMTILVVGCGGSQQQSQSAELNDSQFELIEIKGANRGVVYRLTDKTYGKICYLNHVDGIFCFDESVEK